MSFLIIGLLVSVLLGVIIAVRVLNKILDTLSAQARLTALMLAALTDDPNDLSYIAKSYHRLNDLVSDLEEFRFSPIEYLGAEEARERKKRSRQHEADAAMGRDLSF